MQAIEIKLLPPTNTKDYRYKATCAAGTITVERDYETSDYHQVVSVVAQLQCKLDWSYPFEVGHLKNGNYVAVLTNKKGSN